MGKNCIFCICLWCCKMTMPPTQLISSFAFQYLLSLHIAHGIADITTEDVSCLHLPCPLYTATVVATACCCASALSGLACCFAPPVLLGLPVLALGLIFWGKDGPMASGPPTLLSPSTCLRGGLWLGCHGDLLAAEESAPPLLLLLRYLSAIYPGLSDKT